MEFGFMAKDSGFRIYGLWFMVYSLWLRDRGKG